MQRARHIVATSNDKISDRFSTVHVEAYRSLLAAAGLPPAGLEACLGSALVALDGGEVVGGVALELHGDVALLRSLVVAQERRGTGLGRRLVEAVVDRADELGVRRLLLLTETAGDFFSRWGFERIDRRAVPVAVQQSVQFRSACPQSAAAYAAEVHALRFIKANEKGNDAMTQSMTTTENTKTCCGPECCGTAQPAPADAKATRSPEQLVDAVRSRYAEIAATGGSCCGPSTCGSLSKEEQREVAKSIGYSDAELEQLPEGANLGLGCGAPVPALALQPGESVLDLGSGAGLDVFIAAELVGPSGKVLGVDMTPEMVERARANAARLGVQHAEFRLGRLEALPVESASIDAVTSNCVVNLVPEKRLVFQEIARVLKPGGRVVISDIMLARALPPAIADDLLAYTGCVAGASRREQYFADLGAAGLTDVEVLRDVDYLASVIQAVPAEAEGLLGRVGLRVEDVAGTVRSVTFRARRPIA